MNNKKQKLHHSVLKAAKPFNPINPINPSPLSVAIRQTLRPTTRRQIAPLVALSLAGLATPALAQDAVVELSSLDGNTGFVLNGVTAGDLSGTSVSAAGDVNGDGVDDLLIGADRADPNGSASGASYVVFGNSDTTPPVITATLNPALPNGLNGWYVSDIGITWTIADPESAFMIDSGCVDQTINFDTDALALSCTASSVGGSNTVSEIIKRDATVPVVTLNTPAEAAVYVLNQVVTAVWSASDATLPGSGLASSSGSADNGQPVDTSTVGAHTFSVIAADVAGNQTSVDHNYTVLSATQAIDVLIGDVQALGLPNGLENNLLKKLQNAQKDLAKGNTAKATALINDFINQVNAQSGKKIDAADAAALVAYAQLILAAI